MNKTFCLITLLFVSPLSAQEWTTEAEQIALTTRTYATTEYESTVLRTREIGEAQKPAVKITTDAPDPDVRAWPLNNTSVPPRELIKVGDGVYILEGTPGSRWTVLVWAKNGGQYFEYLQVRIGEGEEPPPDPIDPPPDPIDGKWDSITEMIDQSEQKRLHPRVATLLATAYQKVIDETEAETVEELQAEVRRARGDTIGDTDYHGNWFMLFNDVGTEVNNKGPPTTVEEYKELLRAIIEGLGR